MDQQNLISQRSLPNSTMVLVLGIVSILGCCGYGVLGIICGIIALALATKDQQLYKENQDLYTAASYSNLKAGKICAIVGLVISAIFLITIIFAIATVGFEALKHPETFMQK